MFLVFGSGPAQGILTTLDLSNVGTSSVFMISDLNVGRGYPSLAGYKTLEHTILTNSEADKYICLSKNKITHHGRAQISRGAGTIACIFVDGDLGQYQDQ